MVRLRISSRRKLCRKAIISWSMLRNRGCLRLKQMSRWWFTKHKAMPVFRPLQKYSRVMWILRMTFWIKFAKHSKSKVFTRMILSRKRNSPSQLGINQIEIAYACQYSTGTNLRSLKMINIPGINRQRICRKTTCLPVIQTKAIKPKK